MKGESAEKGENCLIEKTFECWGQENVLQFNEDDHPSFEDENPADNGFPITVKISTLNDENQLEKSDRGDIQKWLGIKCIML